MLVAPMRPAYFFFIFERGPGFKVPLNFRALAMWTFVHRRMMFFPTASGLGATTIPPSIQEWSV